MGLAAHLRAASLPEVPCPFSGPVVHLPHVASHRNALALLCRTSDTSRVLSPSLRPCINSCQACSILAPLMGFCLQRSVHILSRTPFGSPCPAFPWLRRRPFGHSPCGAQVFRPLPRLFSFADAVPALASDRCTARPCLPWIRAWRAFVSGFPVPGLITACLHSNHALACRNSRNQAQEVRAFSGRCSSACRVRTSLGCSALQGLTVRTLDWISPVSPLSHLPSPRGRWLASQGFDRSSLRQVVVCAAEALHPCQSTSPSWASYPRTLTCCCGSGPRRAHVFTFERGARCRLAIRSSLPDPHFLLEHFCLSASGRGCRVTGERSVVHAR